MIGEAGGAGITSSSGGTEVSSSGSSSTEAQQQAGENAAAATDVHAGNREFSSIESLYRQNYASSLASGLSQYGYDIFRSIQSPSSKLAVPDPSYLLGPGDRLRIRVWGTDVDAEFTGAIDRNGTINVPKIGIVPIAGARFGDAEGIIRREAEKYVQGININVALAELRSLEIYVVGEVRNPGLHMVPPFSTILGALSQTGGIRKSGSLRGIQLMRDDTVHSTLDLYDLIQKGDKRDDVILHDRDIVFVPRIGATAAVVGAAAHPAIYELKAETSISDLMALAGGQLPQGFGNRVYLRRFQDNAAFVVHDIDTVRSPQALAATQLQNGDLLELQFLAAAWPDTVNIEGHVWFPDVFQWRQGLRLSQVIAGPQLLKPEAITEFAHLFRYDPVTTRYSMQPIPLQQLFDGTFDTELQPHDRIRVLSREELHVSEPLRIAGAVYNPGEFPFRPGATLGGALSLAGGLRFGADANRIDISRQIIEDGKSFTRHLSVEAEKDAQFPLQAYDYIFVRQVKEATEFKQVSIEGEVRFPGSYRIADGERVADILQRAGGFTDEAYYYGCQYFSDTAQKIQQVSLDKLIDDLQVRAETVLSDQLQSSGSTTDAQAISAGQSALRRLIEKLRQVRATGRVAIQISDLDSLKNSPQNIVVGNGDRIVIPKRPEFVSVVGSVYTPNSFLYQPQDSLAAYLAKAGGPTQSADEKYMYVLKANGEVFARAQEGMFRNKFENAQLMPGDTIVVPEKLDRVPYLLVTRDIADIMFKIATTAGVAIAL
ncbi:MAG: SLBB domain-containing protein [Thermodesulfobacteriota bacterium]